MTCDHGRGELTGNEYGWVKYYTRPWRRFFMKTIIEECRYCGEKRLA